MSMNEQMHPFAGYRATRFQWSVEAEALAQAICMQTKDFHRAFGAFASKKTPKFEGN